MKTCFAFVIFIICAASAGAITIDTVPVTNPGNQADMRYVDADHPNGVGAVSYSFNIGKTKVTNAQYVAMLNAVAKSDPYGLYSTDSASDTRGGIVRSGASGNYTYAVKAPALNGTYTYDNKPVVFVGSGDAMRFANWLNNGQPTGVEDASTTESGAYTLNGVFLNNELAAVTRNAGAGWFLPNENEWYKAAYHKNDGVTGNYWDYATRTNTAPNNNQPSSDTGNSANFRSDNFTYTTGSFDYPLTDVGAYTLSRSPYGTFDQGGDVWDWNETLFLGSFRGIRGASWLFYKAYMPASFSSDVSPDDKNIDIGFRVASAFVPEPSAALLAVVASLAVCCLRKRR